MNMITVTTTIAKILAAYLLVTGIGFVVSSDFYEKMIRNSHKSDGVLVNLSGMVHFLIGISILSAHFLWGNMLEIIVSLLGFMFTLKGIFLITLPKLTLKTNENPLQSMKVTSAFFISLGLILVYLSYFAS